MAVSKFAAPTLWLLGTLAAGLLACGKDPGPQSGDRASSSSPNATAGTGSAAAPPVEDGEWRSPAKNFASTRYSGLEQINAANVARLQPAFTFSTGVLRGHEAVPIWWLT